MEAANIQEMVTNTIAAALEAEAESIRRADAILLFDEGGFGHTIQGPDFFRRLHVGKRCLVLFLEWPLRHNTAVPLLWHDTDVRYIRLPLFPGTATGEDVLKAGNHAATVIPRLTQVVASLVRERYGKDPVIYRELQREALKSCAIPEGKGLTRRWETTYYQAIETIRTPRPRLPAALCALLGDAIAPLADLARPRCTVYLRQKGGDISGINRSGSSLADYLPAIRLLKERGYTILLMGDLEISQVMDPREFVSLPLLHALIMQGPLGVRILQTVQSLDPGNYGTIPAGSLSHSMLVKGLLDLFAMSEVDIFVGECGGGSMYAPYQGIPTLMLNTFPWGIAIPNCVHMYKTMREADGSLTPLSDLLTRYQWTFDIPSERLEENSAEEILAATRVFLEHLAENPYGYGKHHFTDLPADCWLNHCNAAISGVFLNKYLTKTA